MMTSYRPEGPLRRASVVTMSLSSLLVVSESVCDGAAGQPALRDADALVELEQRGAFLGLQQRVGDLLHEEDAEHRDDDGRR